MTDLAPAHRIYHFATPAAWYAAQQLGEYVPEEFADEGFIHCATAAQIDGVVQRHLRGGGPRIRLTLDPLRFGHHLQYEWSQRSGDLYPHIYVPIPLDAVLAAEPFDPGPSA